MKLRYLIIIMILLCCSVANAATWLDPSLKWKTLETPHFSIHFHDGLEDIAKRLAPMAEEVHEKLVPIIKHKPDLKTNVVLLDTVDYGNGFATVIPDPRVTLYLTDWSTNLNPSKYDLWLRFLFTHEYTHILHLDIAEGSVSLFRFLFGRVIFPNGIQPMFIIEGLATYMETEHTRGGRGNDPRWEMMMRMDVLEDNIKSIDQAAVGTVRWPMGNVSYLYGVEFLEYLVETYGEDKLITLTHIYGDFLYSFGIDGAFIYLYRKNLSMLWNEWLDSLGGKYGKVRDDLGEVMEPKLVTRSGYYNLKPKWSRGSKSIYYQQSNVDGYPSIREIDVSEERDKKLVEASVFASNLSLGPDGRNLLFVKSSRFNNFYQYKDLYEYDLERNKIARLTEGMRITDADLSPDGSWVVFVENKSGTKTLIMMARDGSDKFMVCSYEANVQYFSPRFSPDGKKFVVAKWSPGGKQKIYLVNPQTGVQKRVTEGEGSASEANPAFSPDGKYIFFDSDRTGIVNLYAYHLESKRLYQVTNVLGGAMMPDISLDGKQIAYVSYSSKGYDVAVLGVVSEEWKEVRSPVTVTKPVSKPEARYSAEHRTTNIDTGVGSVTEYTNIHDYNPIPTLIPKFWLPYSYTNENGSQTYVYTQGSDILSQHNYVLQLGYDFEAERPQYSFLYNNNQFLPQISFMHTDVAVPYSWDSSTLWMREKYGLVSFSFYDYKVFSDWDLQALAIGYEQTNIGNISSIESLSTRPSMGNINGILAAYRYSSARRYAKSISSEDGIDMTLRIDWNSRDLGGDYSYTNYSASASTYFPTLANHHVLAPTLYGFYSKGELLEQSNFTWKYLPIRGYPSTNLRGNKGALLSTEYRFPILYAEKGFMYGYTFFDKIWGNVFYDIGGADFGSISDLKLKRSYGAELNIDTLMFWYAGATLKLGYVKGIDEDGEEKFYFGLGGALAGLF